MPSRCYLATSDLETIYPSFVQDNYDPTIQTICTDIDSIPLAWMALFRAGDIRRETFDVEDTKVVVEAPVVERLQALRQLDAALPYFKKIFEDEGQLDGFFAQLRKAIEAVPAKYITLEMQEIALMFDDDQWFYDEFRQALKSIGTKGNEEDHERFLGITQIRDGVPFPSATMYLDGKEFGPEDQWNFTRIIGAGKFGSFGWGREVPWETKDANYSFAYTPLDDEEDELDFEDEDFEDEDMDDDVPPPTKK